MDSLIVLFEGDNFNNFRCVKCKVSPLELNYLADGIICPKCIDHQMKKQITQYGAQRYVILTEPIHTVREQQREDDSYDNEIKIYINGK